MRYTSKKDPWIVFIVVTPGVALAGVAIYHVLARGSDDPGTWLLLGIALCYDAIIGLFAYPVYYEITTSNLLIRSGLLRLQIPLSTIETARPTRNPLSAPAWSLDRLRLDYRKNGRSRIALISPDNKTRFLHELVERTTNLELRGNQVSRSTTPNNP